MAGWRQGGSSRGELLAGGKPNSALLAEQMAIARLTKEVKQRRQSVHSPAPPPSYICEQARRNSVAVEQHRRVKLVQSCRAIRWVKSLLPGRVLLPWLELCVCRSFAPGDTHQDRGHGANPYGHFPLWGTQTAACSQNQNPEPHNPPWSRVEGKS